MKYKSKSTLGHEKDRMMKFCFKLHQVSQAHSLKLSLNFVVHLCNINYAEYELVFQRVTSKQLLHSSLTSSLASLQLIQRLNTMSFAVFKDFDKAPAGMTS